MYLPHFNVLDDADEVRRLISAVGTAELITPGAEFPLATRLPVLWDEDAGRLVFHLARANGHWRAIAPGTPALAVVTGPEAYVSPSWYASKAEHGRVVPTWNYSAIQFTGHATVHEDAEWLRDAVTRLTATHEQPRDEPWAVTDAPPTYVDKQLRAIVGVELVIADVQAKAKLSQNRDDADAAGVVTGLRAEGGDREHLVADAMEALRPPP
ncbi:MAG: transcriptional regulator [Nocardioidaceae bacterium]|nr:transcriptional regulator [Nocardioidaceae bacterium]